MTAVLRFLADENFDNDILRGLLHRTPDVDVSRAQDVGLMSASDPDILEWAARERRIVLTHDARTMIGHAYARVRAGQAMPGLVVIRRSLPIGTAIDALHLLVNCSAAEEWDRQVVYLPL